MSFAFSLTKTRPDTDLHMGALLRGALERHGVPVRVTKPWASLPHEYLVAQAQPDGPRVWIHCNDHDGRTHYDIPRTSLMAVAAVVTDEKSTRFVYDGFTAADAADAAAAAAWPAGQAKECARAVAAFLDLPEYPTPLCTWCDDYGLIEICDASTDAVISHRPCNNPPCVARGEERAAVAAQRHTDALVIGAEEFGPQVCTECRWGGYTPVPGLDIWVCTASGCGHTVDRSAFDLAEGERLDVHNGHLHLVRAWDGCPF